MTERYGFIYIWRDRKHKRYYIGCHWGHEDDKYICSSTWMRNSYNRRKNDFKRRTIKKIYTDKKDMFLEEQRYLDMIKDNEIGKRYYNLNKTWKHWLLDEQKSLTTRQKISKTLKDKFKSGELPACKGRKLSEEHKKKISNANKRKIRQPFSVETRMKISDALKGRQLSDNHKEKLSLAKKGKIPSAASLAAVKACKGRKLSEEHKKKISESVLLRYKQKENDGTKYFHSEENRKKISKAQLGKKRNPIN